MRTSNADPTPLAKKTLLHILMHIGKLLRDQIADELAVMDLHHGQGRVLVNLKRHGPMNQANLGRGMHLKPATITTMLKPMEQRGLIVRTSDPKTNRAQIVALTDAGQAMAIAVEGTWQKVEKRLRKAVPEAEREQLFRQLEAIREILGGHPPRFAPHTITESLPE